MAIDSDPTVWIITTIDDEFGAEADSDPTAWITTSVDDEPTVFDGDSDPTAWIITKISPEFPADDDSDPTEWIIATISEGSLASGIFLVIAGDTLMPIEID